MYPRSRLHRLSVSRPSTLGSGQTGFALLTETNHKIFRNSISINVGRTCENESIFEHLAESVARTRCGKPNVLHEHIVEAKRVAGTPCGKANVSQEHIVERQRVAILKRVKFAEILFDCPKHCTCLNDFWLESLAI